MGATIKSPCKFGMVQGSMGTQPHRCLSSCSKSWTLRMWHSSASSTCIAAPFSVGPLGNTCSFTTPHVTSLRDSSNDVGQR